MSRSNKSKADQGPRTTWTEEECVQLCESWRFVCHDPITGADMSVVGMWKNIHRHYSACLPGTPRKQGALSSHWRELTRDLFRWKVAFKHATENTGSGYSLEDEIKHAQLWYAGVRDGKTFTHLRCWEVVKDCPKFLQLPENVLDSPMTESSPHEDSPMEDSPGQIPVPVNLGEDSDHAPSPILRPQGRKAAKNAKKNSPNLAANLLETVAKNSASRLEEAREREACRVAERDHYDALLQKAEEEKAARRLLKEERQLLKEERHIMAMDTSNMSPDAKAYWRQERRDIMSRRRLFREGGTSSGGDNPSVGNTDWFGGDN